MNDATTAPKKADMEKVVEQGMRLFERAEESLQKIADLWEKAQGAGMISKCEADRLKHRSLAIFHEVNALHCEGTKIAQDNQCDVITTRGGPGR